MGIVGMIKYIFQSTAVGLLLLSLMGCSEELPKGDPATHVSTSRFGLRTDSGIVVGFDMKAHFLQMLVSGYKPVEAEKPAAVEMVSEMPNCIFPRPDTGAKIYFLSSRGHYLKTAIYTFGLAALQEQAHSFVKEWRANGYEPRPAVGVYNEPVALTNVVVTDTSQPLHIVLGGMSRVIYNFQIAPGVKITGVSLLAASHSGVANLPTDIPLAVLGPTNVSSCNALPHHKPQSHWQLAVLARERDANAQTALNRLHDVHKRFSSYFQSNFGVDSESRMIGGEGISNYLVGLAPNDLKLRVPYKSLHGATVRMTRPEKIFIGSHSEYLTRFRDEVRQAAEQLVPGSLASLNRK
jgi:hypothetical protein